MEFNSHTKQVSRKNQMIKNVISTENIIHNPNQEYELIITYLSKIEIEFGRLTMTCHEIAMPPIGFFRYRFSSLLTYDHVLMMSLQSPSNVRADRAPFAY